MTSPEYKGLLCLNIYIYGRQIFLLYWKMFKNPGRLGIFILLFFSLFFFYKMFIIVYIYYGYNVVDLALITDMSLS